MRRRILFLTSMVLSFLIIYSNQCSAKKLNAGFNFATFYSPEDGTYLETYLGVRGNSVVFEKQENGMFRGALHITMIFRQDSVIKAFRKYELWSPEQPDTTSSFFDFIDQQRISLPVGVYELELSINDRFFPDKKFSYKIPVEVFFDKNQVIVSGIQMLESYKPSAAPSVITKNGLDLEPRVTNYYPQSTSKLRFYSEIYNTDTVLGSNEKLMVSWYIQPYESGKKLDEYSRFKIYDTKPVQPLLAEFDLTNLPTGNYNLAIEVRDKSNKIVGYNNLFFQRNNPAAAFNMESYAGQGTEKILLGTTSNADTLRNWVLSLRPIATLSEKVFIDNQSSVADPVILKRYLSHFWEERNEIDPEGAWLTYLNEVKKVDKLFGNKFRRGYDTDRGRVYLQYGPPNSITDRPFDAGDSQMTNNKNRMTGQDGGVVPYQIWHYYVIKNQRNKKFVFYNPHLAGDEYSLIHSDAQGEFYNSQWQSQLKRIQLHDVDQGQDGFDGQSGRYYNDPF